LNTGDASVNGEYYWFGDPTSLLSTNTGYGEIVSFGGTGVSTFSRTYYWSSAGGGSWVATDADTAADSRGLIAMALNTQFNLGMLLRGYVYFSSWNWTVGAVLYLSTTPGTITETQPTGTGDIVRVVGYAITARLIYFNPSQEWIELV